MNVSIIGAGRTKNGIGKYIANYFHKNGARVVALLGTSEKSAGDASMDLKKLNIQARPYGSFGTMLKNETIDSIVIASPYPTHYDYLNRSVDAGLDIFCEKPFIWQEGDDISSGLEQVLARVKNRNLILAMNSQWPFSISSYEELCGPLNRGMIQTFFMRLAPASSGEEMVIDSLPHALSLLYFTLQDGKIDDIDIKARKDKLSLKFKYYVNQRACKVLIKLVREKKQPRTLLYGFNDKIVKRGLDLKNYDIFFTYGGDTIKIPDPLELSVKNFIFSVKNRKDPMIGPSHIKATTQMLNQLTRKLH